MRDPTRVEGNIGSDNNADNYEDYDDDDYSTKDDGDDVFIDLEDHQTVYTDPRFYWLTALSTHIEVIVREWRYIVFSIQELVSVS